MDNSFQSKLTSKKAIFIIIIAAIIAILLVVFSYLHFSKQEDLLSKPDISRNKPPSPALPYTVLPLNKVPDALPPGIPVPVEPPNLLLLSYSQVVGNKEQTTIQFISSKSAAETLKLYKDYFKNKGWTVISTTEESTSKSLLAKKEKTFLSIIINSKESGKGDLVDLTIVAPKKQTALPPELQTILQNNYEIKK
jgi:hypothetical protein